MPIVKKEPKSKPMNARLPVELADQLVAYSKWAKVSKSAVVQAAIGRLLRQDTEWQSIRNVTVAGPVVKRVVRKPRGDQK